jgi:DNA-binding winged helix-turn-helix (wHTH) protein
LLYSFEDFSLDTARRELRRSGALIALQPQVFDLLEYLIRNRERVVSKDDLLAAVWNGRIVSESTLGTRINAARSAIGDSGEKQRLLRSAYGKGIRFVGVVHEEEETIRKLAAIFAADVEGYSRLMGQDEIGTLRRLTAAAPFSTSASRPIAVGSSAAPATASSPISPVPSMRSNARSRCRRRSPRTTEPDPRVNRCGFASACMSATSSCGARICSATASTSQRGSKRSPSPAGSAFRAPCATTSDPNCRSR